MRLQLLVYILALGVGFPLMSQVEVKLISAETGKPIPEVQVNCWAVGKLTKSVSITDSLGKAVFPELKANSPQKWIIQCYRFDYNVYIDTISLSDQIKIRLIEKEIEADDVVITGQYQKGKVAESSFKIKVISSQLIRDKAAINLKDALRNEMNFRFTEDAVLGSGLSLQGQGGQNLKIMIDGVPVIGRQDGNIDPNQLILNDIERIEVVEGPLSVKYGSNALVGTINIITKKKSKNKWSGHLTSYNENIGNFNLTGGLSYQASRSRLSFSGGRNFFDGWSPGDAFFPSFSPQIADSTRFKQWNPKEQFFARGQYRYAHKKWILNFRSEFFDEKITNRGLPRAPYNEIAFDDYYLTRRFDQALEVEFKPTHWQRINILAGVNQYRRQKNTYVKNLTTLEQVLSQTPGDQDTSSFGQLMSRGSWAYFPDSSRLQVEIGYDATHSTGAGPRIEGQNRSITDAALFLDLTFRPIQTLTIRPGLRYGYNSAYNYPVITSLHTLFQPAKNHRIQGSYARGFRSPSLKELYLYFVDVNHDVVGNPALEAEYSHSFNLAYTYDKFFKRSMLKTELAAFYNLFENRIILAQIDGASFSYANIGEYRTWGASLNEKYIRDKVEFSVGGSVIGNYNPFSETDKTLTTFTYTPQVRSSIVYKWQKTGLRMALFHTWQGRLPGFALDNNNEVIQTFIGAYQWMDLTAALPLYKNKIRLSGGAKNILNVQNIQASIAGSTHSSGQNAIAVGNGRVFFMGITLQLDK